MTTTTPEGNAFIRACIILSSDAIDHGIVSNTRNPKEEHINERVHWSVMKKGDFASLPEENFTVDDQPL